MGGREDNRIFIGGIGWNTTERLLKDAFARYGKILDCLVMTDRNTGRPRGFAFITFADRRSAEDALRDMHGRELDGRVISVNRADPKIASEEPDQGYGGSRGSARDSYRTETRTAECFKCGRAGHWARDCPSSGSNDRFSSKSSAECFKCGRAGHWARDCPSSGSNDRFSSKSAVGMGGIRGDRYGEDRFDDHFHGTRFSDRERFDSRDRYGARDRYENDRYPAIDDRFGDDRFGGRNAYPGYGRERSHERYRGVRGGGDRYMSGGPTRYDQGIHRDRPGPYDHPRKSSRVSGFDRY